MVLAHQQTDWLPFGIAKAGVDAPRRGHQLIQIALIFCYFQTRRNKQGQKLHLPAVFGMQLQQFFKGPEAAPHRVPGNRRRQTWSEKNPEGRWRSFDYEEIAKRDKVNLDIFWLKDESLEDSDDLPDPDVLAQEIADDLETALDLFTKIAAKLGVSVSTVETYRAHIKEKLRLGNGMDLVRRAVDGAEEPRQVRSELRTPELPPIGFPRAHARIIRPRVSSNSGADLPPLKDDVGQRKEQARAGEQRDGLRPGEQHALAKRQRRADQGALELADEYRAEAAH